MTNDDDMARVEAESEATKNIEYPKPKPKPKPPKLPEDPNMQALIRLRNQLRSAPSFGWPESERPF